MRRNLTTIALLVQTLFYATGVIVGAVPLSRERLFDVPLAHQPGRKDAL